MQSRQNERISKLQSLIILLFVTPFVSGLKFKMLEHFRDSRLNQSTFTVMKDDIPPFFTANLLFTVSIEATIVLNFCFIGQHALTMFKLGDAKVPMKLKIKCVFSILRIEFLNTSVILRKKFRKTKQDGKLHYVLNFVFDVDVFGDISLYLISKEHDDPPEMIPLKTFLYSVPYNDLGEILFEIKMSKKDNFHNQIKNVYVIDESLSSVVPDYKHLDRGLALLRQAIYFYIEPANSKILLNRSRFNHMHATNGKLDEKCHELQSHFNPDEKVNVWTMQSFYKETLRLPLDLVSLQPDISFTIVLNLEIYPRNLDPLYFGDTNPYFIWNIFDKTDNPVFNLSISFADFIFTTNILTFKIKLKHISTGLQEVYNGNEFISDTSPLSIESIQVYIDVKSTDRAFFYLNILRRNKNDFESTGKEYDPSLQEIDYISVGDTDELAFHTRPPFIISLFDLMIFEGGYFFTISKILRDLRMVSLDTLEVLYCEGNQRPSRYFGLEELDKLHELKEALSNTCNDLVFNIPCAYTNCEICGFLKCLVCKIPYILENGLCINKTDSFEPISRINLESQGKTVLTQNIGKYIVSIINFPLTNDGVSVSIGDEVFSQTELLSDFVEFQDFQCNVFTGKTLNPDIKKILFGADVVFRRFYFPVTSGNSTIYFISKYELQFLQYISFKDLCSSTESFFNGNYPLIFCDNINIDFSSKLYYYPIVPSSSTLKAKNYLQSISNNNLILSCKNNCDCSKSANIHVCEEDHSPCDTLHYIAILNSFPLISSCLKCDDECTDGCTGPLRSNCIIVQNPTPPPPPLPDNPNDPPDPETIETNQCSDSCETCDAKKCVSCPLHSNNLVFQYDANENNFTDSSFYFCEPCQANCAVCQSSDSCVCQHSLNRPFASFDKNFNFCQRIKCDNCSECRGNGVCLKCQDRYFLDSGKCVKTDLSRCSVNMQGECKLCSEQYFLTKNSCQRCSSNCKKCQTTQSNITDKLHCTECQNQYFLFENKCFKIHTKSEDIPLLNQVYDHMLQKKYIFEHTYSTPNCSKQKNQYSSICKKCNHGYYLSSLSKCKKCPISASACIPTRNHIPTIIKCESGFYLDASLNKCINCSQNCLSCSKRECHVCKPNFRKYLHQCISCPDPNCDICLTNSSCFKCFPGFVYSEKYNLCIPCGDNCKFCTLTMCLKCFENYVLDFSNICRKKCEHGLSYFSEYYKKCVSCNQCNFCYSKGLTECSSCNLCKRKCKIDFRSNSIYSFSLVSDQVIFPIKEELSYSMIPNIKSEVDIKHNRNTLTFYISPENPVSTKVATILHKKNLITKKCSLERDILVLFPFPESVPKDLPKIEYYFFKASTFVSVIYQSGIVIASMTPFFSNINSLVFLVNTNQMFTYSFVKKTPSTGIYAYLSKLIRKDNVRRSMHYPIPQSMGIYYLQKTFESNIISVKIFSYFFFVCLVVILLYVYLEFFHKNKEDEEVKELEYLFMDRRMDRDFMQRFFRVYSQKISHQKMYRINNFFRRTKKKIESSILKKKLRAVIRSIYKNRNHLVFFTLQVYGIRLSHLCAKSSKLLGKFTNSFALILLCFGYHMILGVLLFISYTKYLYHSFFVDKYLYQKDLFSLKEFFVLSMNIYSLIFCMVYTYLIVFFGDLLAAKTLNCIGIFLLLVTYCLDTTYNRRFPCYIILKLFHNFTTIVIIAFSKVDQRDFFADLSDLMFLFVNVSTVVVQIYCLSTNYVKRKVKEFIKENERVLKGE